MPSSPQDALARAVGVVLERLGSELPPDGEIGQSLLRYVAALARYGAHADLVGAHTPEGLAEIALADALVLARRPDWCRAPGWELGAGGASLSVPLAVQIPAFAGTLIEPRQKRATFLRLAIGSLGLAGRLRVEQSRVDPARPPRMGAGCALARAVFPPDIWIPFASAVVQPGLAFAVLTTEAITVPHGFDVLAVEQYQLPFSGAARVATWVAAAV